MKRSRGDALHRRHQRIGGLVTVLAVPLAAGGLASLLSWLIPDVTAGLLPHWFVAAFESLSWARATPMQVVHTLLGLATIMVSAYWVALWVRGDRPDFIDAGETATAAFWLWVAGWLGRDRVHRLHLRDALMVPRVELAWSMALGMLSALLAFIPGPAGAAAMALHRVNALYLAFLVCYAGLALALHRRTASPYATIIEDGHVEKRRVRYE